MQRWHIIITLLCVLWASETSKVFGRISAEPDSSFYSQYPYIVITDGTSPLLLTDEDFFDSSARLQFPVNRYNLPVKDSLLRVLSQTVFPQVNGDSLRLLRLLLRGAASPEGPWLNNRMLGRERANTLYRFMKAHLDSPMLPADSVLVLQNDIEDYRTLCLLMRRANDPDYAIVQALCDEYLPQQAYATLKRRLHEVQYGHLWPRLLKDYFPQLRAARFMMILQKSPPPSRRHPQQDIWPETDGTSEMCQYQDQMLPPVVLAPLLLPRREYLSVKTNLLLDMAYMPGYNRWCPIPNVAVEYYPLRGNFTFGASLDFPWWQHYDDHKYFQVRNYQLETRYYLRSGSIDSNPPGKGAAFRGLYFQGYVNTALFGICFDADRGWEGEGFGGGVGVGYVLPLSRSGHWRLELQAQAGYFTCHYDPYQYENPVDPTYIDHLYYYKWTLSPDLFKKRQYRFNWIGPTRIGVTLTYDLLYRRVAKRGVGLRSWEIYEVIK